MCEAHSCPTQSIIRQLKLKDVPSADPQVMVGHGNWETMPRQVLGISTTVWNFANWSALARSAVTYIIILSKSLPTVPRWPRCICCLSAKTPPLSVCWLFC